MTITNDKDCRKYQDELNEITALHVPKELEAKYNELSEAIRKYHTQQLQLSKSKKK